MGCKAVVVCQCRVEWLSRWLLMAHWRCTKAFDLSASLPCTLAGLSTLSILVSVSRASFSFPLPFLSSSLSPPRSGFFPTLCLYYSARCSSFVAVPLFFPEQRIHTYIHVQAFPSIGCFHSLVYSRLVSAALAPHSPGYSSPRLLPHCPSEPRAPAAPTRAYSPLRPAFIAQQNLHDSSQR